VGYGPSPEVRYITGEVGSSSRAGMLVCFYLFFTLNSVQQQSQPILAVLGMRFGWVHGKRVQDGSGELNEKNLPFNRGDFDSEVYLSVAFIMV
jgi:hypothetical protein